MAPTAPPASGVRHWLGVAREGDVARWLATAEAALAAAAARAEAPGEAGLWPCSLPLNDLPELLDEVCRCLEAHEGVRAALGAALGPRTLLAEHSFVRHQPAPVHRRGRQQPHSWHQDGALGFDFIAAGEPPYPPDAMLVMQTCWLPLTPCGNTAPALGWIDPPLPSLLPHTALADIALDGHLASLGLAPRRRHTVLAPGDVLQFGGGTVHRTHATAAMHGNRTSVELRWLPAGPRPARLATAPGSARSR